jgi:hypothetical protein
LTAPFIGLLLNIVNWIFFFVSSHIRRSPSLPFNEAGRRMERLPLEYVNLGRFCVSSLPADIRRVHANVNGFTTTSFAHFLSTAHDDVTLRCAST